MNAPFAYYYPPELFSKSRCCHYLHFEKKYQKQMKIILFLILLKIGLNGKKKKKSFDGYMKFDICKDCSHLSKFPLITYEDEKWRILGGIYISNFSSSIIELIQKKKFMFFIRYNFSCTSCICHIDSYGFNL